MGVKNDRKGVEDIKVLLLIEMGIWRLIANSR